MQTYSCKICKRTGFLEHQMRWDRQYLNRCKKCWTKYCKEYRLKRKNAGKPILRIQQYGLTDKQYYKLVELHLGGCAICKQSCKSGMRLAVDHDHKTGKVRGLLCGNCNQALGRVQENEDILIGMIEYLKNDGVLNGINY